MWNELRKHLNIDPAVPLTDNVYLGMKQSPCTIDKTLIAEKRAIFEHATSNRVPMASETDNECEEVNVARASSSRKKKKAAIASLDVSGYQYDLTGNCSDCVDRYLELSGLSRKDLKEAHTPCMEDSQLQEDDFLTEGQLAKECSKVVLKCLWIARLTRPDIYWTVNYLARYVSKWTKACDKRLYRLICYLNCTTDYVLQSYVGDTPEKCQLILFCDASFAGDIQDSKSTTGGYLFLMGPNTCVPLGHMVKKQGAVSHSSTEAEIISLDATLRMDGLPA